MSPRIAIIYDRINKFGGAERVLIALKAAFPNAVFFTSVYSETRTPWTKDWNIRTSFLQKLPFAKNHHDKLAILMPLAFESFDLTAFEIVISVTSEFAKSVITNLQQLHICYCLTPTRYLWSHTTEYEGKHFRSLKRFFFSQLREIDYLAGQRPDHYIAISKLVERRIRKYYRRETTKVISPPLDIEIRDHQRLGAKNEYSSKLYPLDSSPYFLVVSRLIPYKRIDIAIEACLYLGKKLIIIGTGSEEKRLKHLSQGNPLIQFVGFVSEEKLTTYYHSATALLCPQEEDFGIVSLEAQAHGVPVISFANSGMAETIIPGKTGILFDEQTPKSLATAIALLQDITWDKQDCMKNAAHYSQEHFIAQFQQLAKELYQKKEMMLYNKTE